MKLTEHFSWDEATFTHHRDPATGLLLPNEPGPAERAALENTFMRLEHVRQIFLSPLRVHSAFRSPGVNAAAGGRPDSQHMRGEAVDFSVPGWKLRGAFRLIQKSTIPYDQLIEEAGSWIHVSFVGRRSPRLQALTMRVVDGCAKYERAAA